MDKIVRYSSDLGYFINIYDTYISIGDLTSPFGNIHPRNKETVSKRLAWAAEALTYGESVPFLGPAFVSMSVAHASPNAAVNVKFSKVSVGGK